MTEPFRDNLEHLVAELVWLNLLLQREVRLWRQQAGDSQPDFRGVYSLMRRSTAFSMPRR